MGPSFIALTCALMLPAQQEAPIIDVYTMGVGNDIFAHFGHTAICVTDAASPHGRCYNYGTADFSTPVPLTYDFIRGRALFWVSVADRVRMLSWYEREDRSVWRQRLPLAPEQAVAVARALEESTGESVKYYRYHHFNDNCTTRIRDLVDRTLGGPLSRDTQTERTGPSFREYARQGFAGFPGLLIAAAIILGRSSDQPTTRWEEMFLPEIFRDEVELKLGAKPEIMYARKGPVQAKETWSGAAALAGIGLLLGLIILLSSRAKRYRAVLSRASLAICGLVLGIPGTALLGLAVMTAFDELRWNEVLLVLVPFDLALIFLGGRPLQVYLRGRAIGLAIVAALSLSHVFVQPLAPVLVLVAAPIAAALRTLGATSGPGRAS